jgi:hypothetical protein
VQWQGEMFHKTFDNVVPPAAAGMLGERGLGLVVHIPSGCVAKINIP